MKPSICLCMIVKNEAHVIERCLASVRDLIDTWVISDTGSSDGTQQLIRAALDGIPGELHEEPWADFGHNRTLNIRHAHAKADYLLLLDADLVIHRQGPLPPLTADSYLLRHEGATECRVKRLVRGDIAWRYEGVTHEYLTSDQRDDRQTLDALVIEDHADGERGTTSTSGMCACSVPNSSATPTTPGPSSTWRRPCGISARGTRRSPCTSAARGWAARARRCTARCCRPGSSRRMPTTGPAAMDALSRAWESRPQRLEACYELSSRLRGLGRHRAAHAFVCAGLDREPPDDLLFVQPWVYRWGLLFEYSITAYRVGDIDGSLRACDRLLSMPDLPEAHRRQTLTNREFAEQRQATRNASWASPPDWRRGPHLSDNSCSTCHA